MSKRKAREPISDEQPEQPPTAEPAPPPPKDTRPPWKIGIREREARAAAAAKADAADNS